MWKLKLQYFGHVMQRADSFEKTLMMGNIEGRRGRVLHGIAKSQTQLSNCTELNGQVVRKTLRNRVESTSVTCPGGSEIGLLWTL